MFGAGKCVSKTRLNGKTVVVTGCNTGIGKITVKELYKKGGRIILACRDLDKAEIAVKEIKDTVSAGANSEVGELIVKQLDLASLKSIKQCALDILQSESKINILVNNAGIMMCPRSKTEDGFELQLGVNHLGHFLFTCLLLPRILNSTPARIVNLSSVAHKFRSMQFEDLNMEKSYSSSAAYGQSKLANILFSNELARRLKGRGVNIYSVHPGFVKTELGRHIDKAVIPGTRWVVRFLAYPILKTPEQGAQTTIYCAVSEEVAEETGYYYSNCKKSSTSREARDSEKAARLWHESVKLVGLGGWDPFTASSDELPPILQSV